MMSISHGATRMLAFILAVAAVNAVVRGAEEEVIDSGDSQLKWHTRLPAAQRAAGANSTPILVRLTSPSCPWCAKLETELAKMPVRDELGRWTLAHIDVTQAPDDARRLGVVVVPTLQILSAAGHLIATHEGYLDAAAIVKWLQENHDRAIDEPDAVLFGNEPPSRLEVMRLARQFRERNAVMREAAIRRMLPYPKIAGSAVVRSLREGELSVQLAAYELLEAWKAPLDGIDPWQPDSLTPQRLESLDKWLRKLDEDTEVSLPEKLSDEQKVGLDKEIQKMLRADPSEAAAIRERIARRFGAAALPVVVECLQEAATDDQRVRALALRYRLVAGGDLVLHWPGGLERLAAIDPKVRHQAATELADRADPTLQPLLLELFADEDPLVREISLRGLKNVGGERAISALVKLLHDPEPNVRAAVLKQLTEDAPVELLDKISEYVRWEKDPDLLVHAIRYFREVDDDGAIASLLPLTKHDRWQVRAEAAEALSKILDNSRYGSQGKKLETLYDALLELLGDSDPFVVGRALDGLSEVNAKRAVQPLVDAAGRHPQLARQVVQLLAAGDQMRTEAVAPLRRFFKDDDPEVRAAAILGLAKVSSSEIALEMQAALDDPSAKVRSAGAYAMLGLLTDLRPDDSQSFAMGEDSIGIPQQQGVSLNPFAVLNKFLAGRQREEGAESDADEPAAGKDAPDAEEEKEQRDEEGESSQEDNAGDNVDGENELKTKKEERFDGWLRELYAGKHRPKWMATLVPRLREMLSSDDSDERLAAARTLVPLGLADQAIPVMLDCAAEDRELLMRSARSLTWLVWPQRVEFFQTLRKMAKDEDQQIAIVEAMSNLPDVRATELYWEILEQDAPSMNTVRVLESGLRNAYLGNYYYDASRIPASRRRLLARDAGSAAREGATAKRLVAFDLLLRYAADDALAAAQAAMEDETLEPSLRKDMFQILLAAQPRAKRIKTAIATLQGEDAARKRVAVQLLAVGADALVRLPETGFSIDIPDSSEMSISYGGQSKIIIPEPPRGLRKSHVEPLLDDPDPKIQAYAGYLLTLFDDAKGLEPLLKYWRGEKPSGALDRLVYRAIAVLNDSSQLPVLKTIYRRYRDSFEIGDFYWTIRIMSGQEMLRFRKQIRDEVDPDYL